MPRKTAHLTSAEHKQIDAKFPHSGAPCFAGRRRSVAPRNVGSEGEHLLASLPSFAGATLREPSPLDLAAGVKLV